MSDETIWVLDSDICDECGGLMGDWGFCLDCGYDGVDWDEEADDAWWYPDDEDEVVLARAKWPLLSRDELEEGLYMVESANQVNPRDLPRGLDILREKGVPHGD